MHRAKFKSSRSGSVALIYALSIFGILAAFGMALDYSRSFNARNAIHAATDNAALAGAKLLEVSTNTDADVKQAATELFRENLATANQALTCPDPEVVIDREAGTVVVSANCNLPTTLLALIAINNVAVGTQSAAKANLTRLDVAFMLDVSGSMAGSKLNDLKSAAWDAADILITPSTGDRVRLSFNTYATAVNAGPYAAAVKDPDLPMINTCVSERHGVAAWKDDGPGKLRWLGEKALECPESSVLPLTSDAAAFKAQINTLKANGLTAGHIGVAWAWYLISPEWDDVWPAASKPLAYDEPSAIKAVILMTDGDFNTAYEMGQGSSTNQARKLCKKMRDEGIVVYSVAFKAPKAGQKILKECAGNDANYFEASNGTELREAYREIASRLSNLRLTE